MSLWFLGLLLEVTFGGLIHLLFIASIVLMLKGLSDAEGFGQTV